MLFILLSALAFSTEKTSPNSLIGKIGDKSYTYAEYNKILENYYSFHSSRQGGKLSPEDKARLNNQCWEELIGRMVYDNEIKNRRLAITDAELLSEAKKSPPEAVKQIKELQSNNKFDKVKYETALSQNEEFKRNVSDYIKQTYQYTKLFNVIKSEVKVDADSVKRDWTRDNNTADAQIIFFDHNKLTHMKAEEADIQLYYNTHKEDYRRENGRSYRYYKFAKSITHEDSLATQAMVDSLYQAILAGADFGTLAQEYSKDPGSAAKGGDLGFFSRGRMVKPFEEAAFNTEINQVAAPIQSQFGWHIVKVTDKRQDASGKEEVQASHILIRNDMSEAALKKMKVDSQKLYSTAELTGLVPAAALLDYELSLTEAFIQTDRMIVPIGGDANIISFAFTNPIGSLSTPYYATNGDIYILEVADSLDVFYIPLEREKTTLTNKVTSLKRMDHMKRYATEFAKNTPKTEYLQKATADSLVIVVAKDIKKGANIQGIGKVDVLVDAILSLEQGEYTELIENANSWYLAYLDARKKPDPKDWDKNKNSLISKARDSIQTEHLNKWYYAQKQKLSIEDKRKDFYDLPSSSQGRSIQLSPGAK